MQFNTNANACQSASKLQWKPINQSSYIAKLASFSNSQATSGQQEQYSMNYTNQQNWSPSHDSQNYFNQVNNTWSN